MSCGHDGWQAGCAACEAEQALALEAMGERSEAPTKIAWLTGLYGVNPAHVGAVDGSEDDFGDMIGDLLHAIGIDDQQAIDLFVAVEDAFAAVEPTTWEAALEVARNAARAGGASLP